ncbi:MAG: glycosyltransferase [Cyclobacteriaceae bacterium]|nr:glycosyltransferase [Cyclobacteriaceae bacterium]
MEFFVQKKILIISPEYWSHIPVSKHHYAMALARNGNQVFFLNPPSSKNSIQEDSIYRGVWIVDYVAIAGVNRLPAFLRDLINRYQIHSLKKLCQTSFDVVWSFDAFRFHNLKLFNAKVSIYHVADVHHSVLERQLANSADIILSVSQKILDRYSYAKKRMKKINHGFGEHFLKVNEAAALPPAPLHVGYVGNLNNWNVDVTTMLEIVDANPSVQFTFMGPYQPDSLIARELKQKANCTLYGRVDNEKLPQLFEQFHFFMMCYGIEKRDASSNSHKILEYLTTGKPVVMNYTDEYDDKRDLVFMTDRNEELPRVFQEVCANYQQYMAPAWVEKRKVFAFSNSYLQHVKTIDQLVVQYLESQDRNSFATSKPLL